MDGMVGHAQIKALKRRSAGDKKNVLGGTISHREIGALIYMKKIPGISLVRVAAREPLIPQCSARRSVALPG